MPALLEKKENACFVLSPNRSFYYENRSVPSIQSDRDVIIRVVATGICGSDVHYWQHGRIGNYAVERPLILGHESVGVVTECGPAVEEIACGDRVALEPGIACNHCEQCRRGFYNLCPKMQFAATPPYDGTLAQYYRLPEECCFKLPSSISLRDAVLIEPLSIAVHCCRLAGDIQGKSVVIFGAGPVGQLCCGVAKAFGASQVVVADIAESRLDFTRRKWGTDVYCMTRDDAVQNATALLASAALEQGSDVVIDATGAEACINCGVHVLKRGGTFVQVGLGQANVKFPMGAFCEREAIFKASFRYGPGDYRLAINLLTSQRVEVKGLVTHEFAFTEAQAAFETAARKEGIKAVIYGPNIEPNGRSSPTPNSTVTSSVH